MLEESKRIETDFEIALVFVFGSNWRDCVKWCSECGSYVPMVTTLTAATLEKASIAEIYHRAETGELHYQVTAQGKLRICFSSLLYTGREPNRRNLSSNFSEV